MCKAAYVLMYVTPLGACALSLYLHQL